MVTNEPIDIIDLNDPDYANLSNVQIALVRAAQKRKNEMVQDLRTEIENLRQLTISNGTARSSMRSMRELELSQETEEKIEVLKSDLDHQLAYEALFSDGNDSGPYSYPANPNYHLNYSERFLLVREYYMRIEKNAQARLEAYGIDSLARTYLGEYYQTLYELLLSYC